MRRTRFIYSVIMTVLFLSMLLYSLLNDVFHYFSGPKVSYIENRFMARKPVFDISFLDPYPGKYSKYFNDQFPYRASLMAFHAGVISYSLFKKSPYPKKVDLGKDGWLFFAVEKPLYEGTFDLNNTQIAGIVSQIHQRADFFRKRGIRFYFTVPPTKEEIYPEFLPANYFRKKGKLVMDRIFDAFRKDSTINFIDLRKPLLQAKKNGRLYFKTDHHWNSLGAYYAYLEIINRMKMDFPQLKPLSRSDFTIENPVIDGQNLAVSMDLAKYIKDEDVVVSIKKKQAVEGKKAGYKPRPDFIYPKEFEIVREIPGSNMPKIVIIRDSYIYAMVPFLDETFAKTLYIYDTNVYGVNETVISKEKPDIVLIMIYEPHLINLIGLDF